MWPPEEKVLHEEAGAQVWGRRVAGVSGEEREMERTWELCGRPVREAAASIVRSAWFVDLGTWFSSKRGSLRELGSCLVV